TEAIAAMAEAEAARVRLGLGDPKDSGYKGHEARPLSAHLADFHRFLVGKGDTRYHADLVKARCARLIELAGLRRISDLTPSAIQAALKRVRDGDGAQDPGVSLRTVHHYTRQAKAFSKWLWRDGRARADALAHLTTKNPDPDRRHVRRALSAGEL